MPMVLALVMLVRLPESVRHLAASHAPVERVRAVLRRISPSADAASSFVKLESTPAPGARANSGMGVVLSRAFIGGTLMLWLAYFMGLVIFYALINWMPIPFKEDGLDAPSATLIALLFPLGGVGAVLLGWLMARSDPNRVIALCFGLTSPVRSSWPS